MSSQEKNLGFNFSIDLLSELLDPDAVTDRENMSYEDIYNNCIASLDIALEQIEKLIYLRAFDSRIIADCLWDELEERIARGEKVTLGKRVRVNRGTLEVSYFRNVYQGNEGGKFYYADHVKRSGKFRYLKKDFKFAQQWERDLALGFEEYHAVNRKIFKKLSAARKNLRLIKKEIIKICIS